MNRQNVCVVAILALALVAWGQEPKDDRIEVKVVGPTGSVTTVEPLEIELEDLDLDGAVGSLILGVEGMPQDADQKGERKKVRAQDADQDGTIVREIDLGDGRTMRITITTKRGEPKTRTWVGGIHEPHVFHVGPEGKFKTTIGSPEAFKNLKMFGEGVHDFQLKMDEVGGEMKDHMDRAMRAFDRAREEFIRAYKEGGKDLKEKRPAPERRMRMVKPEGRVTIGKAEAAKEAEVAEKAAKAMAEAAESHEKQVEKIKGKLEEDLKRTEQKVIDEQVGKMKEELRRERDEAKARRGAVQWVDTAPGASTKGEIESLRREIKELEKMVRELREALEQKK